MVVPQEGFRTPDPIITKRGIRLSDRCAIVSSDAAECRVVRGLIGGLNLRDSALRQTGLKRSEPLRIAETATVV